MRLFDIYSPGPAPYHPTDLPRYAEDELRRVQDLKEDRLNQVELHWDDNAYSVTITSVTPPATGAFTPLIPAGTAVDYVCPDILYDQTTGVITVPYNGEYVLKTGATIHDPGGTVTLEMWLALGGFKNGANPPGNDFITQNEQTKGISTHFQWTIPCVAGDTIDPWIAAYADTYGASVTGRVYLELKRLR